VPAPNDRQSSDEEVRQEADAHLPHDRDEKAAPERHDRQHDANRGIIRQAKRDVDAGIVDTERIGTPNDVPSQTKGD